MNLLAHAYLSGDNEHLLVGNFIADHLKGNNFGYLPEGVVRGIQLHRLIDHYTDQHPMFNRSCNRLYHRYHKYSGVVVDILYDHFLARRWANYHHLPLQEFTEQCYSTLLKHYNILPSRTRNLLPHIMMENWLLAYYRFDGLEKSFKGMSRRVKYNPGLEYAVEDLRLNYDAFETDFRDFFPELISYADHQILILTGKAPAARKSAIRRNRFLRFAGFRKRRHRPSLPSTPEMY
ncbi:MAG TPA: ACP phosphodiesterase [Bacteroidales bacterium]|nr:ACP phosphodiesterase [Bacteroidales bacterium]HRZ48852.1 ACP phosphodiesterase [Bacteroidales bacterium]